MDLRLRPLRVADETQFRVAHEAMKPDGFGFGLGLEEASSWTSYLEAFTELRRGNPAPGLVPATFLVAVVGDQIVGRSSIRHELNEFLAHESGHIGYGVTPEHRRRGYATEILRQSVIVARAEGVDRVLVTCDEGNVGSATAIERCGGVFESLVDGSGGVPKRRYWID